MLFDSQVLHLKCKTCIVTEASMYAPKGIVRIYRRSNSQYTIPDNQNTFTWQSVDTNNAPRDPLCGPVTWNPAHTRPFSMLQLRLRLRLYPRNLCQPYDPNTYYAAESRAWLLLYQVSNASIIISIYNYLLEAI